MDWDAAVRWSRRPMLYLHATFESIMIEVDDVEVFGLIAVIFYLNM